MEYFDGRKISLENSKIWAQKIRIRTFFTESNFFNSHCFVWIEIDGKNWAIRQVRCFGCLVVLYADKFCFHFSDKIASAKVYCQFQLSIRFVLLLLSSAIIIKYDDHDLMMSWFGQFSAERKLANNFFLIMEDYHHHYNHHLLISMCLFDP